MVKFARVDFETSDPTQLRAAIKLPQALRTRPNGVSLRIAVRVGRAPEEARDFVLRELPAPSELAREAGADSHVFAYRIDEADLPRLAAFRAELLAKKSSGQGGSVSISVQPLACKTAELPEGRSISPRICEPRRPAAMSRWRATSTCERSRRSTRSSTRSRAVRPNPCAVRPADSTAAPRCGRTFRSRA
jgi:hypothetical protein